MYTILCIANEQVWREEVRKHRWYENHNVINTRISSIYVARIQITFLCRSIASISHSIWIIFELTYTTFCIRCIHIFMFFYNMHTDVCCKLESDILWNFQQNGSKWDFKVWGNMSECTDKHLLIHHTKRL